MANEYIKLNSSGDPEKAKMPISAITVTTSTTFTKEDAGTEVYIATDALVMTLDALSTFDEGDEFTFRNTGADGNNIITLRPAAADAFVGSIAKGTGSNASANTADSLISKASGVVDKDWVNTKATSNIGDYCKVRKVGTIWLLVEGIGIWVSEP